MTSKTEGDILLVCDGCGNKQPYARSADPDLPLEVVRIVTNECDKCESANGGFGGELWLDAAGNEVEQA